MWNLMTRAFQWCITLYSRKWTVWLWEAIFCKKLPEKQLFWRTRNRINWLWAAITTGQNLQISKSTSFSESSGRQLSDELLGRPLTSILSDRRPLEFFLPTDTQKHKKMYFFVFPTITQHSDVVDPIWVAPWESWRPDDSKNVWLIGVRSFWTGVIAAQSQQSLQFLTRPRK